MASRIMGGVKTLGRDRNDLTGSFQPNGANATVLSVKGVGFTVGHTVGTNLYVVTFADVWFDFDSQWASLSGPNYGIGCQPTADVGVGAGGTKQMTIAVYDTSAKTATTDLAFVAGQRISFGCLFKNTSGNF